MTRFYKASSVIRVFSFQKKMFLLKWNRLIRDVTVEPCCFFYFVARLVLEVTNTNLYLQKACRFNATSEPDLNASCDNEKRGILFASKINSEYRFYMLITCCLFTILWTSWSDITGKRRLPLIYLPIIGLILQSLFGLLHSYFWQWYPIDAALCEMGCEAITGGMVMLVSSTSMYILDVTTMENRTMRLGIMFAIRTLSEQVGLGASGFILRAVGFFYSYMVCLVLTMISLILALIFIKDVSVPVDKKPHFLQFFNPSRIADSFRVVFKKSLGNKRIIVWILMAVGVVVFFTTVGEKSMFYLFFRFKFHWNEREFSVYTFYKNTLIILGSMICSIVLSKHFKMHDGLIGMFVGIWDTVAVLGYLFASQGWQLYAIASFELFHGNAFSCSQSLLSKHYRSDEFGRLQAVQIVFGLIIPTCFPAYNTIFQKTLDFFPSAFFILSAFLDIIIVFLYWLSYFLCRKFDNQREVVIT